MTTAISTEISLVTQVVHQSLSFQGVISQRLNENGHCAPEEHLKRADHEISLVTTQDATIYDRPVYDGKERIDASVEISTLLNIIWKCGEVLSEDVRCECESELTPRSAFSMQPYHTCRNGTAGYGSCQAISVVPAEPVVWVSPPDQSHFCGFR